ncbi:thioredoxin family protein [Riemerella anatipestifer]|nr:thioredoxin family protein [Riemerella anatipestifer]MCD5969275.1 thioredoxin family protein [Riemerella anatipestifer]MCU7541046.1 thioredoxin family protein [Riemerella anatipestifer]MCU7570796.1 thioredoxin family protein [Riemerella anatipestifer]MCU7598363.1 thioredoxin family protein [Riemerella anatipestifer]MCW0495215.1 thioredoxin family protein [Riemerella anatipestifer]
MDIISTQEELELKGYSTDNYSKKLIENSMSFFIFVPMKKTILLGGIFLYGITSAQFKVNIEASDTFSNQEVILYTLNGSKDYIAGKAKKTNGKWSYTIPNSYIGMMRAYFPENDKSFSFISENKDISVKLDTDNKTINKINFLDEANNTMQYLIKEKQKKEKILPVLVQIRDIYNDNSSFNEALKLEIKKLEQSDLKDYSNHPFISYYWDNAKYLNREDPKNDYINFLANTGELLETSSLLKPVLINFISSVPRNQVISQTDALLDKVNIESPRGQTILSELLNIFDAYGLDAEKDKYYQQASNLKCSINKNLEGRLEAMKSTMVGSSFKDYIFSKSVINTKSKKLSDIKSNKKLILFWSSECPHCVAELPLILESYNKLKSNNIEVIGLSLDTNAESYQETVKNLPWINDSELKGWNSSYADTYNINATPSYFLLDSNNKILSKPNSFGAFLHENNLK